MRFLVIVFLALLTLSCSGNLEKNLVELDKVYGKCDNPYRYYGKRDYKICKAQEAAGDPNKEAFSVSDILNQNSKNNNNIRYISNVNPELWRASLKVLESYPLKNADSNGGYIETEVIYDEKNLNERCTIKVSILSEEFLSSSINSKIICEERKQDSWIIKNENYSEEEKKLTLKILNEAQLLKENLVN